MLPNWLVAELGLELSFSKLFIQYSRQYSEGPRGPVRTAPWVCMARLTGQDCSVGVHGQTYRELWGLQAFHGGLSAFQNISPMPAIPQVEIPLGTSRLSPSLKCKFS